VGVIVHLILSNNIRASYSIAEVAKLYFDKNLLRIYFSFEES